MNHRQTQTIKLEATEQEAKLWKDKANAISISRSEYLLSLLRRRERVATLQEYNDCKTSKHYY